MRLSERSPSELFSRRGFLTHASRLGASYAALCAASELGHLHALAAPLTGDSRIAATPLIDKGFAAVRQIGKGIYATISDRTKGMTTRCNGGIIIGRDGALLIEGFQTPQGAAFQMDALRMVTQIPVRAAINTHYHYDHSLGNSFYGANGIAVWAHAKAAPRMMETYPRMQAVDRATFLAPWEQRISAAKTGSAREHAKSDLEAVAGMYDPVKQFVLALPNHSLDPATMPMAVDLGGMDVVIETYVGHTDTDIIVRVPEQNIVFTGDLMVNAQYPTNINGYPTQWRATLKKFATFEEDTIFVPGHGQPCGQEGVALMRNIFDDIAAQAGKLHKAGVPIAEAEERYVVPGKWKNFRMFSWGFCIGRTMEQLYAEWGTPTKVLSY